MKGVKGCNSQITGSGKPTKVFLDSGAFSFYRAIILEGRRKGNRNYDFFETKEFWDFVDSYAEYIKKNKKLIDTYVNVDAISNPAITWKVQKYLEDTHKLNPLPVFHIREDFKYLKRYIDNYDYIGISGVGNGISKEFWISTFADPVFNVICDKKGFPKVKVHGFSMTSPDLLIKYPFYSCDSSSWMQFGKYGLIVVPKKKEGKFNYELPPTIVIVSQRKIQKAKEKQFNSLPKQEQHHIIEYVESKGFKFGKSDLEKVPFDKSKCEFHINDHESSDKEIIVEKGICNSGALRDELNLAYYLDLESHIPKYPWAWDRKKMTSKLPV